MPSMFVDLRTMRDYAENATSNKNVFAQVVDTAIRAAMANGRRQAEINMATAKGSASNDEVRYVFSELNRIGYKAQLAKGNVLEVTW